MKEAKARSRSQTSKNFSRMKQSRPGCEDLIAILVFAVPAGYLWMSVKGFDIRVIRVSGWLIEWSFGLTMSQCFFMSWKIEVATFCHKVALS